MTSYIHRQSLRLSLSLLMLGAFFLVGVIQAQAATIYTNSNTGDDVTGDGTAGSPYATFHKAYIEASADDTIDLTGTFDWTDADETGDVANDGYTIGKNLTIQGQAADETIVQADSTENTADRRVFLVSPGVTATMNDILIRHGRLTSSSRDGGGVRNDGILTMNRVHVDKNRSTADTGGGISNRHTLTVNESLVTDNYTYYQGGGILNSYYIDAAGYLTITNTTVAYNHQTANIAYTEGAGVFLRAGDATITNSSIVYNQGDAANSSTCGVGADDPNSDLYIKNTIVAHNECTNQFGYRSSGRGNFVDNGGNIIGNAVHFDPVTDGDNTSWFDEDDNDTFELKGDAGQTGTVNVSATLADNDSLNDIQSYAISAGSIVIDNAQSGANQGVSIPTTDGRGLDRVGTTDIGAYEFGAQSDNTDPTVQSFFPADNAVGVSVSETLILTFDEAVDAENGSLTIYKAEDDSIVQQFSVITEVGGSGTTTISIDPTADLESNTTYYVQVDAIAFDDAASNSFAGISDTSTWNFTTADIVAPSATGFSPVDGAIDVAVATTLSLTFDEAITVGSGSITLYTSGGTVVETFNGTSDISGSGTTTLTMTPSTTLEGSTAYYVQVDASAVTDGSLNAFVGIADETTWNFSTVAVAEDTPDDTDDSEDNTGDDSEDAEDDTGDTDDSNDEEVVDDNDTDTDVGTQADDAFHIVTGAGEGSGPQVRVFDGGANELTSFFAYNQALRTGVNVATGDLDGDGTNEIVTVPVKNGGPLVKVFTKDGELLSSFMAFSPGFRGGLSVAVGDLNGDGTDEIIVAPASNGGPHVKVFDANANLISSFFAFNKAYRLGLHLGTADTDGNGKESILVAPGTGYGPQVRIFNEKAQLLSSFFAFPSELRCGAFPQGGDTDGDGADEILVGAGEGCGPYVRVFNGDLEQVSILRAYGKSLRSGVRVVAGDLNSDNKIEFVTVPGIGGGPHVRAFNVANGQELLNFFPYAKHLRTGASVAVEDL